MAPLVYLPRTADSTLREMVRDHSAVLVVGPRATGKTTTCMQHANSVVQLGDPQVARALAADPRSVLHGLAVPILIDEWQEVPESLQAIKLAVDADSSRGHFIVTGSVRGDIDAPTWPGTGRLVRLAMYGLTEREVEQQPLEGSWLDRLLTTGDVAAHRSEEALRDYVQRALRSGFPDAALNVSERGRNRWLTSYVDQVITRDVESLAPRRDPQRLRAYLSALAINSSGVVDDVTLWTSAGIAKDTARAYDSLLQSLFIVDRLPAWTSNRLKRLTLAPKRYLIDAGLFTGVLGVTENEVVLNGDLLGRVIETFVVAQFRAEIALLSPTPRMHHLRTSEGRHEIDLVIEVGASRLIAIEVKATSTPDTGDIQHLRWFRREMGDRVQATVLLHTGRHTIRFDDGTVAVPISALWSTM